MSTTVKTCFKCGETKAITDFYRHPMMGDGRLGKCKVCTRKDVQDNYNAKIERYREYDRRRGRRPGPAFKERARQLVHLAVMKGELKPQECSMDGEHKGRIEAHHEDYTKPLDVVWLCKRHHSIVHTRKED